MTSRLPGTDAARHGTGTADLTVMLAAHDAFRRDLTKLAKATDSSAGWTPDRCAAVNAGWQVFKRQLAVHHRGEDTTVWPLLRERVASSEAANSVLDAMEAEHHQVDPLLNAVDAAFFAPGQTDGPGPHAADAVAELASQLSQHLEHEERDALPIIGRVLTAQEWRAAGREMGRQPGVGPSFVPEFFGWLLDGAAADKRTAVLATLPGPMRPLVTGIFRPLYARRPAW